MQNATASLLGSIYMLSELGLALTKRAKSAETRDADRGSLRLLWIVILASVFLAFSFPHSLPAADMGTAAALRVFGIVLFAAGLGIRWYSIFFLGRFFTVDVAIGTNHRIIDTGPYRFVRHPSYTGALMAFLGLGLCLDNWASLVCIVVPVFSVFLRRISIEEAALLQAFGEQYRNYMDRSKRLIPGLY